MGEKRKTIHINEAFQCENCGAQVPPIVGGGCRNHCPYCLVSKHVDEVPGDRQCECLGLMDAVDIEYTSKKGYMISHKCRKCGTIKKNKIAADSKDVNDSMEVILEIMRRKTI